MRGISILVLVACATVTTLAYRQPTTFELVSVRRSPPAVTWTGTTTVSSPTSFVVIAGGRFEARGQTLENLARVAYGFEKVRPGDGVVSAPARWVLTDRFDVTASADQAWGTVSPGVMPAALRSMLQALLSDRFALSARIDTRKIHGYALRIADRRRGPGPGLRPSDHPCTQADLKPAPAERTADSQTPGCVTRSDTNHLEATGLTMAEIARRLVLFGGASTGGASSLPDRLAPLVVEDQTGLSGAYDLALSLSYGTAPDPATSIGDITSATTAGQLLDGRRRMAFEAALRKHLGLEIVPADVLTRVLIIEKAKKPKEDESDNEANACGGRSFSLSRGCG